ncbi:MAG: hypothetical protein V1779_14375 [bacterium]
MYDLDIKKYSNGDINIDSLEEELKKRNFDYKNEDSVFHILSDILQTKKELIYLNFANKKYEENDTNKALEYLRLSDSVNNKFIPSIMFKAIIYYDLNKADLAIEKLNKILDIDKNDINAQKFLVHIFEQQGKYIEAIPLMDNIIETSQDDPFLHIKRGILYKKIGELNKAEQNYNQALSDSSDRVYAFNRRSKIFEECGEDSLALHDLMNIIKYDSTHIWVYLAIFDKIENNNNYAKSLDSTDKNKIYRKCLDEFNKSIEENPKNVHNYQKRAKLYEELKSINLANADRMKANELIRIHELILKNYFDGNSKLKNRLYDSALICYKKVYELNPDYEDILENTFKTYKGLKKFDSAEHYLVKHMTSRNYSECYYYSELGNFFYDIQSFERAIINFTHAFQCYSKTNSLEQESRVKNNIGQIFMEINNFDSAFKYFYESVYLNPTKEYNAYNNIGLIHNKLGNIDSAIYYSSKAIEMKKNLWSAYANRGLQFVKKGEFDSGIYDLKKSVSKRPYDTTIFKYLIWAYNKKKDYINALNDCNNILILKPHDAEAYFLIGQVYSKLDSMQRANEMFDLATKIDSNYRYLATLHMVEIYFERNEQKKGKEILNKFLNDYENFIEKVIDNDVMLYNISVYLIKLGSIDVGLDCYKKTTEKNKNWISYSKIDEDFRPVWNHPKYIEINKSR